MIKVKLKRFIAMTMAFCLTILPSNAFATEINLENSSANVNKHGTVTKDSGSDTFDDETTNVWQGGSITEEVRVNVDVASSFTITIPKEIVLNGNDGSATYKVKCEGNIAGDQVICIVPDASFTLNEDGGKTTPVTATQPDTDFTYVELNDAKEYDGSLSAPQISAGNWSGSFYFNIDFKASGCEHDYVGVLTKEATATEKGEMTYTCSKCGKSYIERVSLPVKQNFADTSWSDINIISESGVASEYFSVGDEKELQIGSETYHVQILGFDHDDKSDGSGKAGITVGLKEIMTTEHVMNYLSYSDGYKGGWKDSDMRIYLNNNILNYLPQDVKNIIKSVNKLTSKGNKSREIETTLEDLFLLSEVEIFGSVVHSASGEGSQYQYFADGGSKVKYKSGSSYIWWERSPKVSDNSLICVVNNDGSVSYTGITRTFGISFGFCI